MKILITCLIATMSMGCTSVNSGGNPINRSILFDTNLNFGIDNLPIVLPKINLGIGFHVRRFSPDEEIQWELAKKGRYKGDVPLKLPEVGPSPNKLEAPK